MAQTTTVHVEQAEQGIGRIIFASAAGTMIEWYDFYIFGSLAGVIASKFYTTGTPLGDLIAWLAAFAVGFIVRPFGALVFGRVGDLIGRKYTFLVTMSLMGVCTFLIGLMPTKAQIGDLAGILLIGLRILQGLALGGEYGGAATYVAEHAPNGKRGYYTSWIQITATAGFFISLIVILVTRSVTGEDFFGGKGAFANDYWQGWRIPFVLSAALVAISLWIRISLRESPLFAKLKHAGKTSVNPLKESFGNWFNLKYVLLALFGATMGQGVVWYTGQFYALTILQSVMKLPLVDSNLVVGIPLLIAAPLFVVVGGLSDKYGRKPFMMAGMLLGALTYYPLYQFMYQFRFDGGNYQPFILAACVFIQLVYVTMVYGPIAAFLVELFPTKIRYTSMSLPYHIGNGIFGGLVPLIGLSLIQATGNNLAGLFYPISIAAICFVVGMIFIKETKDIDIAHNDPK
ncbi:MAG TPA: MFS transporter [Thermoflexales bacterium]|mgnify:CR=1 FL=1|nr:MFS transporter [Thermoflexales bacterium]HQW35000.1 MFS transporter [Thermoflexales bacterium]HQZ21687.1 MFS transporter [Thermoflexales bacterium]HRA00546.1 MFS transporter [Thermoflexales bacterium]